MKDEEIAKRLRQKDSDIFDYIMEHYNKLLWVVVGNILEKVGFSEDIEDCISDVYIKLLGNPEIYDHKKGSLKSFLVRVGKNLAIDKYRKLVRGKVTTIQEYSGGNSDEDPQQAILTKESREEMLEALDNLKEPDKEDPLSIQSEYDGIVIKLISAINDENTLRIFATARDIKGDRLGEDLDFTSWGLSQGYGGNVSVVDYNNETKTATLMITSLGNDHQGSATLTVNGFSTGREFLEDLPENNIDIAELLKEHTAKIISQDEVWKEGGGGDQKLYEESRLLKFDEMDISFENVDTKSTAKNPMINTVK